MNDVRLLYVTTKTKDEAHALARALIERKLIACANLLPQMESVYRWKDELQTEVECVMILKTRSSRVSETIQAIERLHSYETPCVLEIKVESGSSGYMAWLEAEVPPAPEELSQTAKGAPKS
jgi:periplasmic divalent cation tolerance protein